LAVPRLLSLRLGSDRRSTRVTPPGLELAVVVHKSPEHMDHEGPHFDRLAVHGAVVLRVPDECLVEVAGHASNELHMWECPDSLELHSLLSSLYGPGNTTSCVTITLNG